ncbi:MAG: HEAT repeat domain-containing protein, partial [Gammaproteobacteria bacterium]|nr:HEAT repeat domain-containing protein [Gammaproteobacteria bacterium]
MGTSTHPKLDPDVAQASAETLCRMLDSNIRKSVIDLGPLRWGDSASARRRALDRIHKTEVKTRHLARIFADRYPPEFIIWAMDLLHRSKDKAMPTQSGALLSSIIALVNKKLDDPTVLKPLVKALASGWIDPDKLKPLVDAMIEKFVTLEKDDNPKNLEPLMKAMLDKSIDDVATLKKIKDPKRRAGVEVDIHYGISQFARFAFDKFIVLLEQEEIDDPALQALIESIKKYHGTKRSAIGMLAELIILFAQGKVADPADIDSAALGTHGLKPLAQAMIEKLVTISVEEKHNQPASIKPMIQAAVAISKDGNVIEPVADGVRKKLVDILAKEKVNDPEIQATVQISKGHRKFESLLRDVTEKGLESLAKEPKDANATKISLLRNAMLGDVRRERVEELSRFPFLNGLLANAKSEHLPDAADLIALAECHPQFELGVLLALGKSGDRSPAVQAWVRKKIRGDLSPEAREASAVAAPLLGDEGIRYLARLTEDENSSVRGRAYVMMGLMKSPPPETIELLKKGMDDSNAVVRFTAAQILVNWNIPEVASMLVEKLARYRKEKSKIRTPRPFTVVRKNALSASAIFDREHTMKSIEEYHGVNTPIVIGRLEKNKIYPTLTELALFAIY